MKFQLLLSITFLLLLATETKGDNVEDAYRALFDALKSHDGDADNFAAKLTQAALSLDSDAFNAFNKHTSDNKNEIKERMRNCREILNNFNNVTFDDFKYMTVGNDLRIWTSTEAF